MARGWRQLLEETRHAERLGRTEKIKKEKRSQRGRTTDDWLIDEAALEPAERTALEKAFRESGLRHGRVIEVHKRNIFVAEEREAGAPETAALWLCSVAKRHFQRAHRERNFVVVGDRVLFEPDTDVELDAEGEPLNTDLPRGVIQHSFARTSRISRKDPLNPDWEHVMLANIDLVMIVASALNPEVRWGLVDRFLVQAEMEGLPAVIVLNKVDLLTDASVATKGFLASYARHLEILRSIGYEIIEVCALRPKKTPAAVKRMRELFKGKLVGLCGHSGVGKSSVLNLMKPELEQVVDENPEIFYKGRHTTTYNSLLQLGVGGYAIDTPGIRSFAVEGFDSVTLSRCFREFREISCRYRACSHDAEPGCGIKQAVEDGRIARERYRSYLGILKGVSFREGESDLKSVDSAMIADLKARAQAVEDARAAAQAEPTPDAD